MSANEGQPSGLGKDLIAGPGFVLGLFGVLLAAGAAVDWMMLGGALWPIGLFLGRSIWVPPFVRVVYRRRWTRFALWPLSILDAAACQRVLMAYTWGFLVVGSAWLLIELSQGRPSG